MTRPTEMLSCQELVELVTDYLEGALPADERSRFEEHIASCNGCRVYLEQMRMTIRLVGSLTVEALPAGPQAELLEAFRGWHSA
jgi:anti-sigma factor RsiW